MTLITEIIFTLQWHTHIWLANAAFTPDTCSPDTSCIYLWQIPGS